jgi:hypothetical protein
MRRRDDEKAVERVQERQYASETEERSGDLPGLKADRGATGGYLGGGTPGDTDRLGQ